MPTYIIRVAELSGDALSGRYIEGPRTPAEVKRDGYGFGRDRAKAWPFPNQRQAAHKARIIERHMSQPRGWIDVLPGEIDTEGTHRID